MFCKTKKLSQDQSIALEVTPDQSFSMNNRSPVSTPTPSSPEHMDDDNSHDGCPHREFFCDADHLINELLLEKDSLERGINWMMMKFCSLTSKLNALKKKVAQNSPNSEPLSSSCHQEAPLNRGSCFEYDNQDSSQVEVEDAFILPRDADTRKTFTSRMHKLSGISRTPSHLFSEQDDLNDSNHDASILSDEEEEIPYARSNETSFKEVESSLIKSEPNELRFATKKPHKLSVKGSKRIAFRKMKKLGRERTEASSHNLSPLKSVVKRIEGERRGSAIYIDREYFVYLLSKTNKNGTRYLRCKQKYCPVSGTLVGVHLNRVCKHNHECDKDYVARCRFLSSVKKRARTEPESLHKIYNEEHSKYSRMGTVLPSLVSIKSTLYKQRGSARYLLPLSVELSIEESAASDSCN